MLTHTRVWAHGCVTCACRPAGCAREREPLGWHQGGASLQALCLSRVSQCEFPVRKPPQPQKNDPRAVGWGRGPVARRCGPRGEQQGRGTGWVGAASGRGPPQGAPPAAPATGGRVSCPTSALLGKALGGSGDPHLSSRRGGTQGTGCAQQEAGRVPTAATPRGLGAPLERLRFVGCRGQWRPGVACPPCPQAAAEVSSGAAGTLPSGRSEGQVRSHLRETPQTRLAD